MIRPLSNRVVVRRQAEEDRATPESLLVLPEQAKEKPAKGKVLAVGEGRMTEFSGQPIPMNVKVGETIIFGKYSGTEVEHAGEKLLILNESEIMGVIE